jgi:hypothetical protein
VGFGVPEKATREVSVSPNFVCPLGAVVVTTCGATGVASGMTELLDGELFEVPPVPPVALVAVAVKVYEVPFMRPVTAHEPLDPVTVQLFVTPETCGAAVITYELGRPPESGRVTLTVACVSPAIATGAAGTPGVVSIVDPLVTLKLVKVATSFPATS